MTTTTQIAKGKVSMQNTQTITLNGKAVNVTPTMLKASKNSQWLGQRVKTGRGAPDHKWTDVMSMIREKVADLRNRAVDTVNVYIEIGELLIVARARSGQDDVAFGKTCGKLVPNLHRRDRAAMMNLAINKHEVLKMVKAEETLAGLAADTLERKLKVHAENTGTPLKAASKRSEKAKASASKRNAKAKASEKPEATVGSSDTSTASKAQAKPVTADTIASDALEQAVAAGIDPMALLQALTKAVTESMIEA